jgi:exopolysaccharide production protein ExoZ
MIFSLQVLRGLAAIMVVCWHSAKEVIPDSDRFFAAGQCGVDIFFVISGIVIFLTARRLSWGDFLLRRIARVVPLYWLVLGLTIAGDWVRDRHNGYSLSNALFSFLFIPSHSSVTQVFPPIVVGWSLNFEIFFYLLCALTLAVTGRVRLLSAMTALLGTLAALGTAFHGLGLVSIHAAPAAIFMLPITLEFVAGMWLAQAWTDGWAASLSRSLALIVAGIFWLALAPISSPYDIWRPLILGVPAVLIATGTLGLDRHVTFGKQHPLLMLGDASYAIYLVHPIVLRALATGANKLIAGHRVESFVLAVAASLVAGLVVHRLVEKRLLGLTNRLFGLRARTSFTGAVSADLAR